MASSASWTWSRWVLYGSGWQTSYEATGSVTASRSTGSNTVTFVGTMNVTCVGGDSSKWIIRMKVGNEEFSSTTSHSTHYAGGTWTLTITRTVDVAKAAGTKAVQLWLGINGYESYTGGTSEKKSATLDYPSIGAYTVTYNANGGSGAPAAHSFYYGDGTTISSTVPTRTGYTFSKWNTKSDGTGTNYSGGASYTTNANLALYAIWTLNSWTVSYNANGGSGQPGNQTKYYGQNLTLSSTKPTRTGYTFVNWNTNSSGTGSSYASGGTYTANSGATLYAQWQIITYPVTFNANGGTGAPASQTKTYGVNLTLSSTQPTRTGYTFKRWNTNSSDTGNAYSPGATYTANAALALIAIWTPNTYTVSYNANGGSGAPGAQTKTYGVTLTLSSTKPTRTGYAFKGWATSSSGSVAYAAGGSYTANAGATLYAVWENNVTYTVTFNANGGTGAPATQSGLAGTSLTLSSTKPTKSNTTATVTVTYDKVETGATISKSSENCTRTTTYTFSKWNTAANGTGTNYSPGQSITLTGNLTLYAIYTSSTSGSVTLPTGTLEQYTLQGWSTSKSDVNILSSPYSPTANITLYAIWAANGYGGMLKFPGNSIPTGMSQGSKVRLVGLKNPENDTVYTIASVSQANGVVTCYFDEDFVTSGEQDASEVQLEIYGDGTYVPPMDYICALNNRLWGCSSTARTIYASALGDPTDFFRFQMDSLDSYSVPVGTAGDFTGCVALGSTVLFFKQHTIHKLMGGSPAEYKMYSYNFDAVSETNAMSAVNCGGLAVYVSEHGIGTYEGSSAGTLSQELGEGSMRNAMAGYDGEKYALYYEDAEGNPHTYVYDLRYRIWTERDYGKVLAFAHLIDRDYVLIQHEDTNTIYLVDSGIPLADDWEMLFKPFYEDVSGSWGSRSHIFEKKRYTGLTFRLELPKDSWIKAEIRCDDGRWYSVARAAGRKDKVQDFVVKTPRCDKMQLRLTGHGPMTILAMEREFTVGSRR